VCPHPDCGQIFRLSDCDIYLRKTPASDWMDVLDRMDAQLANLEERLQEKVDDVREKAREKGRRLARRTVRRIDTIFTPRRLNPDDAKVIFHPIDYVVFNGMKDSARMKNVILLDRKRASADQRRLQRSIQKTVEKGEFAWQTLRVGDDGTVTTEE
jgi:predicted Holliday junction resolvase-like endonuclease